MKGSFLYITLLCTLLNCRSKETKSGIEQANAVWAESIYFRGYNPTTKEKLSEKKIKKLASILKRNNIKYVYLFAGPYDSSGNLPNYSFSTTAYSTVNKLKAYYPEINVLPWIGGIQNKTVHLEDPNWVNRAIFETKKLVDYLQVPGVHVDLEYIHTKDAFFDDIEISKDETDLEKYGARVNNFHKRLREVLPDAFISSVVMPDLPHTRPWKRKTTVNELKELVEFVDQLSFLFYDTQINNKFTYEYNCAMLIDEIALLADMKNIQYLISIGTFINEPELQKYRNMKLENIPYTIRTIKRHLATRGDSTNILDGISVYCDWETDNNEWNQFYEYWASQ